MAFTGLIRFMSCRYACHMNRIPFFEIFPNHTGLFKCEKPHFLVQLPVYF